MEYHDAYHHDLNESNEINNDLSTLNTLGKFKRKSKYYHKMNRGGVQIGVYSSGQTGFTCIRNAETGELSNYVVGSLNEDLFFKVAVATGEFPCGPITLFYNSPEHFEKHQYTIVDEEMKLHWREKNRKRLEKLARSNKSK
jgi:hypothetical protein